jgi:ATP-dependent Clp protease ATP-binding subunit ClpC
VHDLLLQVLGEGRLTDSAGRTVDFGNTIIILTSNLGAGEAGRSLGFARSTESRAAAYRQAVEDYFRPEFVNRLDRIVAFQPLALDDVMGIARLQIERLLARDGFVRRSTCLNVRAAALEEIARKGFDAEMGGRALKRSIERELTWMTAERLVTLPANQPVLFEVHLREGRLAPRVVGLPFTSQRCDAATIAPPEDRDLREFFEKLFDDTARIEETLAASRPAGPADPEYLLLKDRAFELRSRINDVLHALPRDEKAIPAFAFHWKGREKIYTEARIEGFDPNDLFAQIDIRDYLEEKYRGVRKEASAARSMAMESFVALAGLELQYRAYAAGKRDGVCLHIRSSVEKSRDALPKALARRYTELVKSLDPQFESFEEIAPSSDELYLVTSGPGLADFLQSEAGIHLFLAPYGTCTPVQVRVLTLADAVAPKEFVAADRQRRDDWLRAFEAGRATSEEDPWPPGEIVRIYARPGGDQEGTITDVRTGLMVPYGATGLPWFVWAYSNVGR